MGAPAASLGRRDMTLTWAFTVERVTGIEPALSAWESVQSWPSTCPDLRNRLSVSDRESPRFTRVNGPLMARRLDHVEGSGNPVIGCRTPGCAATLPHRTDCCRLIRWREVSRADSRVRQPGSFTGSGCPTVPAALDAGPEAYHDRAGVWWGFFALSLVMASWRGGSHLARRAQYRG
jgi:hypothetical protein